MSSKPGWREIPIGAVLLEPGSSVKVRTGDWRTFKPIIDQSKCVRCLLCWIYCPDASIKVIDVNGKVDHVEIDYEHCKGCGICERVCPRNAITMKPEGE
ncbi:MAG: 4Fe-4S binding protein [Thermoprotei archaeon]|nr:4Fe-4S binding protein [Thermoprotei archaeon]